MPMVCASWRMALAMVVLLAVLGVSGHKPLYHLRPPMGQAQFPSSPYRNPISKLAHVYVVHWPSEAMWGNISLHHFSSSDYVTWRDEGIALRPSKPYDAGAVYSGSITPAPLDGSPVLMYLCASQLVEYRQCIATPSQRDTVGQSAPFELNSFTKLKSNPMITEKHVPEIIGYNHFGNPTSFWQNPDNASEMMMAFPALLGEEEVNEAGHLVAFTTADRTLRGGFQFSHSIWHDESHGGMLENPDLLRVGSHIALKVSTVAEHHDIVVYGNYSTKNANGRTVFVEDPKRTPTYIDYGRWYASKQNYDPILNRTILWGWLPEECTEAAAREQGWAGMLDMPRVVEYDEKAEKFKTYPMPELQKLRMEPLVRNMKIILRNSKVVVLKNAGRHYELVVDFKLPKNALLNSSTESLFGVDVLHSKQHDVFTRIAVSARAGFTTAKQRTGIRMKTVNAANATDCQAKCDADRRCVSWSFQPDPKEAADNCMRRSTLGVLIDAAESVTSGYTTEPVLLLNRTQTMTWNTMDSWAGRATLHGGQKVQLRVFLDGRSVQVFKDGGLESLSGRVYTDDPKLTYVSLFAEGITGMVEANVSLYPMRSALNTSEKFSGASSGSS